MGPWTHARISSAPFQLPGKKRGRATMIEFMRSATIMMMGAVVIGAGVFVLVYGA
ncbi:MAG: hypothetical protein AB7U75_09695 [Hyphomicrobiaceae bacterium]